MDLDKEIIYYILTSTEIWKDDTKLGEEIRNLQSSIVLYLKTDVNNVLKNILDLIEIFEEDEILGRLIREIYNELRYYYEDTTSIN